MAELQKIIKLTAAQYATLAGGGSVTVGDITIGPGLDDNYMYLVPSSAVTDVQVNGTTVVSSGVANVVTNTAYNASTNKIATMSDVPTVVDLRS